MHPGFRRCWPPPSSGLRFCAPMPMWEHGCRRPPNVFASTKADPQRVRKNELSHAESQRRSGGRHRPVPAPAAPLRLCVRLLPHDLDRPVVIAVVAVVMVQSSLVHRVHVVAVRDHLLLAPGLMLAPRAMRAVLIRRAALWVALAHLDAVLGDPVAFLIVQTPAVHVIHVVAMTQTRVPAPRSMPMRMVLVRLLLLSHGQPSSLE